jgi:hypothetical protein
MRQHSDASQKGSSSKRKRRSVGEAGLVLEPFCLESRHASPATPHADRIFARQDIVSACRVALAGKPRIKWYAHVAAVQVSRRKSIVEFEGVDKVHGARCTVICQSVGIYVGGEEELGGVDGIKIDIVEIEDLVERYFRGRERCQGAVADLGEKGHALDAGVAVGEGNAR